MTDMEGALERRRNRDENRDARAGPLATVLTVVTEIRLLRYPPVWGCFWLSTIRHERSWP
jgi:hypothetical protein